MVAETHPHDIELFEYVENELPPARRDEIAAHLATCSVCAQQVELAATGKDALRSAALLELPAQRREGIVRNLPKQEREADVRRPFPKLVFAGLVAVLLVAAVVGIIFSSNGGSGQETSAGGAAAEDATATGGGGGVEAAQPQALSSTGPAEEVAEELRRKGFDASVQNDRVVVQGATKQQVREALADRGPGDVAVVVKNP